MIESNQLDVPLDSNGTSSARNINNTIVDSGLHLGVNTWIVNISDELITGNTFNITFNGVTVNTAFNTDNDTTVGDIITDLEAEAWIEKVEQLDPSRKNTETFASYQTSLVITFIDNLQGNITAVSVTGGASQSEVEAEEFQPLTILPGAVVVSESPQLINYSEENTDTPSAGQTTTYVGEAIPGSATSNPVWRIKRILNNGSGLTTVLYADGDTKFDNEWDNRASLSYS